MTMMLVLREDIWMSITCWNSWIWICIYRTWISFGTSIIRNWWIQL